MAIPHFPNLFCQYGPNTNGRAIGPAAWGEMQIRYAIKCIRNLMHSGKRALDVRQSRYDAYNEELDRRLAKMIFSVPGQSSYFRNEHGRIATNGAYYNLMANLDNGLTAFYNDLSQQGLLTDTLVLTFSEFGRRITENGTGTAAGTDHGAATLMMALGGRVNGGLYGTAANLAPGTTNPTLENNSGDIHYETDFRSVYARAIDNWLGADSAAILGGDFRKASLTFV